MQVRHGILQAPIVWVFYRSHVKQQNWHLGCLGPPTTCSLEEQQKQKQLPQHNPEQSGRPACPNESEPGPETCPVLQLPPVAMSQDMVKPAHLIDI